jgi:hypothetical protein
MVDNRRFMQTQEMNMRTMIAAGTLLSLVFASVPMPASAAKALDCRMKFSLSGWSAFVRKASGEGSVHCSDGTRMKVTLSATGGGITFGKTEIRDGIGKFSEVYDIEQVLGSYASAAAHAGATESAEAQALTKGPVSLALSGKGSGWNVGFAFGRFTISRR